MRGRITVPASAEEYGRRLPYRCQVACRFPPTAGRKTRKAIGEDLVVRSTSVRAARNTGALMGSKAIAITTAAVTSDYTGNLSRTRNRYSDALGPDLQKMIGALLPKRTRIVIDSSWFRS